MRLALGTVLAVCLSACATQPRGAPGEARAALSTSRPFLVEDGTALLAGLRARGGGALPVQDAGPDPSLFWNRLTGEVGTASRFSPPLLARAYALVHVAIHDALAVARLGGPDVNRPRAVAAGAASVVLSALFDRERDRVAGEVVVQLQDDPAPDRALELGRQVGLRVLAHARQDGSAVLEEPPLPMDSGRWTGINPILPNAGRWKTWFLTSPEEFSPEPPYAAGSAQDLRDLAEVEAVAARRTPRQIALVRRWAETSPPTLWNEILAARVLRQRLPALEAARAYAYLNTAMYDAFVACWHTKYRYVTARPFQRLPSLNTVVPTPNFPTYTSGHATISGAASVVLAALFPTDADAFAAQAEEAAESRLLGGIHFRHDNEAGLASGRLIGGKAVAIMRQREAP